jgi:hypothetical protein
MTDKKTVGSVTYQNAGKDYFEKRGATHVCGRCGHSVSAR